MTYEIMQKRHFFIVNCNCKW